MVGAGCLTTKTRKHSRKLFFKDNTGNKKTIFVLLADHDQGWMGQGEKMVKDVNYIPRTEDSEKRHKGENVTTSVLNKKGLPGTFAKIRAWQSGQTFKTFRHIGNVRNVGNVPDVSDVPNVHLIYIYVVTSQINSFSL